MESDQPSEQQSKHANNDSYGPTGNHSSQKRIPAPLQPQNQNSSQEGKKIYVETDYHHKEKSIILSSNTVINPNAMMIEPLNASKYATLYVLHNLQWRVLA